MTQDADAPASELAVARLTKVLKKDYDMVGDPATPIQDLLTDVLHVLDFYLTMHPDRDDLEISDIFERARTMHEDEVEHPHF